MKLEKVPVDVTIPTYNSVPTPKCMIPVANPTGPNGALTREDVELYTGQIMLAVQSCNNNLFEYDELAQKAIDVFRETYLDEDS